MEQHNLFLNENESLEIFYGQQYNAIKRNGHTAGDLFPIYTKENLMQPAR